MSNSSNKSYYIYILCTIMLAFAAVTNALFLLPAFIIVPSFLAKISYKNTGWDFIYVSLALLVFSMVTGYATNGGIVFTAIVILSLIVNGCIIYVGFKKKFSAFKIILSLIATDILFILGVLAYVKYGLSINITSILRQYLSLIYDNFIKIMHMYNPESTTLLDDNKFTAFNLFYNIIPGIIPAVIIISSMFLSALKYAAGKLLCREVFIENSNFSDGFDKIRASAVSNVVLIITFVISMTGNDYYSMIALNLFYITVAYYVLVALAIIDFKLKIRITSQFKRFMIFILIGVSSVFTILMFPAVNIFLVGALFGFIDTIFDYRKLKNNNEDEEDEEE